MSRKKTNEEFLKEVYSLVGDEYTVLGKYINVHTKILMKHNCKKCNNHEWLVEPTNFLQGTRCPYCNPHLKYQSFTKNRLILLIQNKASILKRTPKLYEMGDLDICYRKVFGSWKNALKEAGLVKNSYKIIEEQERIKKYNQYIQEKYI
jgi:hypothetical protein